MATRMIGIGHGVHGDPGWGREHHESAGREEHWPATRLYGGAGQALLPMHVLQKTFKDTHAFKRAYQRRAGQLQLETDRRQSLLGVEICSHHAGQCHIGDQTDHAERVLAIRAFAMRPGVENHTAARR